MGQEGRRLVLRGIPEAAISEGLDCRAGKGGLLTKASAIQLLSALPHGWRPETLFPQASVPTIGPWGWHGES